MRGDGLRTGPNALVWLLVTGYLVLLVMGVCKALRETLERTRPRGFAIEGEGAEAGGIVEGWFTFETEVARGRGHLRLRDGQAWTLLTTMTELKGHEEPKGVRREKGIQHGAIENRQSWLERKTSAEAELGYTRQPYVVVIGGGQGGIVLGAWGCGLSSARSARDIISDNGRPKRSNS